MHIKIHQPPGVFTPVGPYALAAEVTGAERLLFISGTMGLRPDNTLAGDDIESQADQVWRNIEAQLRNAGMEFSHLVKVTTWLARREDWKQAAAIRQRYLGDHRTTMTVVQAGLVDPAWLIEIDAIAVA